MRKIAAGAVVLFALLFAMLSPRASQGSGGEAYVPTDAERARWTMSDMRTLTAALQAFHVDNQKYPEGETLESVIPSIQPLYVSKAPVQDAWGTPLRYHSDPGGAGYTLVSAGADGQFDESTWSTGCHCTSFSDDAVIRTTEFIRTWEYR